MSQENVEVVRRIYDAWARDDFPGPPELLDPEIEYVNPPGAIEPENETDGEWFAQLRGYEAIRLFEGRAQAAARAQWQCRT